MSVMWVGVFLLSPLTHQGIIVSGGRDGRLCVWDLRYRPKSCGECTHHCSLLPRHHHHEQVTHKNYILTLAGHIAICYCVFLMTFFIVHINSHLFQLQITVATT